MNKALKSQRPLRMDKHSRTILNGIILKASSYAVSRKSAYEILSKLHPVSTKEEILRRQELIRNYFRALLGSDIEEMRNLLEKALSVELVFKEKLTDRVIVTDNSDDYKILRTISNICPVTMVTSEEDISALLRMYDIVIFYSSDENVPREDLSDAFFLNEIREEYVAPERVLNSLRENLEGLHAVMKLLELIPEDDMKQLIDVKVIRKAVLDEKVKGIAERIKTISALDGVIEEMLNDANRRILEKAEQYEIRLKGSELLEALVRGSDSISEIMKGLEDIKSLIEEEAMGIESNVEKILGHAGEGIVIRTYPIRIDDERYRELKEASIRELKRELFRISLSLVRTIISQVDLIRKAMEKMKFLDAMQSLYLFVSRGPWCFPKIFNGGIGFIGGRNPFLDNPQPVTYAIGKLPGDVDIRLDESSVTLLTGANSGGKTTLLETMLSFQLMGQAGFPVPAEKAWLDIVDIVRYYKGSRRSLSAGAFEQSLKSLVSILTAKGKKLVLIDELAESMTEPGAAATIISEIIKILRDQGDYCVLVTHLGRDILARVPDLRVDGIEAKGLDHSFRLIVNRQPIFGKIGRSTPELIVKRLYNVEKNRKRKIIYEKILSAFN